MSVQEALRSAILNALLADTGLCAALGGPNKVYDVPMPATLDYPYVTVGSVKPLNDSGSEHFTTLHAWSRNGFKQAHIVTGALLQALDDTPLTLAGYRLINLRFSIADIRREGDGRTYHALVRFRTVTEKS